MNRIMDIPGFKGVIIEKMEHLEERVILNPAFIKAIKTFKNWQAEILNSYILGYSNCIEAECIWIQEI